MKNNRGQAILEYAIVIISIIAALLVMQVYIKRGMQGKFREVANELSQQQYAPTNTTGTSTMQYTSNTKTTSTSMNEQQFYTYCLSLGFDPATCMSRCDLDNDGLLEENVYGSEALVELGYKDENDVQVPGSNTTITGSEHVGELEENLFDKR